MILSLNDDEARLLNGDEDSDDSEEDHDDVDVDNKDPKMAPGDDLEEKEDGGECIVASESFADSDAEDESIRKQNQYAPAAVHPNPTDASFLVMEKDGFEAVARDKREHTESVLCVLQAAQTPAMPPGRADRPKTRNAGQTKEGAQPTQKKKRGAEQRRADVTRTATAVCKLKAEAVERPEDAVILDAVAVSDGAGDFGVDEEAATGRKRKHEEGEKARQQKEGERATRSKRRQKGSTFDTKAEQLGRCGPHGCLLSRYHSKICVFDKVQADKVQADKAKEAAAKLTAMAAKAAKAKAAEEAATATAAEAAATATAAMPALPCWGKVRHTPRPAESSEEE